MESLHLSGSCQKTHGTFKRDDWKTFNEEAIYKGVGKVKGNQQGVIKYPKDNTRKKQRLEEAVTRSRGGLWP